MAVIQYKDKFGNVRTVNSIKGDRGPVGPRGPVGATGPTGPKGGTLIRGSMPTLEDLKAAQHLLNINVGDGYIIEDEEELYIWDGYKWVKSPAWIPLKLDHLIDVTAPDTSLQNADILVYDSSKGQWTNKQLDVDSGIFTTSEDITVTNGVGGYDKGDIIKAGTKFQTFVKDLVGKAIPPKYEQPSLTLTSNIDVAIHRGETINAVLKPKFNAGDSGGVRFCYLYRNNQKIDTFLNIPENIYPGLYQLNDDVTYTVTVEYEEGEIKLNSELKPDKEGMIKRGSVSASVTIKKGIPYWSYATNSYEDPTVIGIMNNPYTDFNLTNDSTIEVNCKSDSRTVVFAYPKSLGPCKGINYVGFDPNSEDIFHQFELDMYDASYMNPIPYYVYSYTAPVEIGTAKFILTL